MEDIVEEMKEREREERGTEFPLYPYLLQG